MRWLTSDAWTPTVRYTAVDSSVVVTTYRDADGVEVEQVDIIDAHRDVLYREYAVTFTTAHCDMVSRCNACHD